MTFKECRAYGREKLLETKHRKKMRGSRYTYGYMFQSKNGDWYFDFENINFTEVRFMLHDSGKVKKIDKRR